MVDAQPTRIPYDYDQHPTGERRRMLERCPNGAIVLDVGAWSGFAGAFLARERNAVVDGVEPNPEAAERARALYRNVVVEPVETALAGLLAGRQDAYDLLLFLDVLEHLKEPPSVLEAARSLVRSGGRAFVSIPNVAHWSVRKELLLGRWRYEDSGLLDRTHLHFYTATTAAELLESAGWRVTWRGWSLGQPPLVRLPERRLAILRAWPTLFAVQCLFEARPS
jgi:2-polyprenyl-3-methyl-5-hydroxy-6-metoxy-1,4-benzoquinol methylase